MQSFNEVDETVPITAIKPYDKRPASDDDTSGSDDSPSKSSHKKNKTKKHKRRKKRNRLSLLVRPSTYHSHNSNSHVVVPTAVVPAKDNTSFNKDFIQRVASHSLYSNLTNKERRQSLLELKGVVLGPPGIGKSSLCWLWSTNTQLEAQPGPMRPSAFVDDYRKMIQVEERLCLLEFFDLNLALGDASDMESYVCEAEAIILVYNLGDVESMETAGQILARVQEVRKQNAFRLSNSNLRQDDEDQALISLPNPLVVLVAHKADRACPDHELFTLQGRSYAEELGCIGYFETSTCDRASVDAPFNALIEPLIAGSDFRHPIPITSPPRYFPSMASDLGQLLNSEEYSDVAFIVEGNLVYAHRLILLVRVPPILEGFGPNDIRIEMPGVSYKHFLQIMEWVYTGRFAAPPTGSQERAELHEAAKKCHVYFLLPTLSIDDNAEEVEKKMIKKKAIEWYTTGKPPLLGPSFGLIFNESPFCDIVFWFSEDQKLLAHRPLLAARCAFFRNLFEVSKDPSRIDFHDVDINPFKLMLYYLYTDSLEECPGVVLEDVLEPLLELSKTYLLPKLRDCIESTLGKRVQIYNAANIFAVAERNDMATLREYVLRFISYRFSLVKHTEAYDCSLSDEQKCMLKQSAVPGLWAIPQKELEQLAASGDDESYVDGEDGHKRRNKSRRHHFFRMSSIRHLHHHHHNRQRSKDGSSKSLSNSSSSSSSSSGISMLHQDQDDSGPETVS